MSETTNLQLAPVPPVEPFLTAEQVAPLLGLTSRTVLLMARTGELPCHRLSVRSVRFLWSEIEASVKSRCIPRAADRAAS
jgi:excisionase family DNA binding protein